MAQTGNASQSLWKNKQFSKMFLSYSISSFGDWFDMIALMILFSYTWHAEPFVISLVPIMYAIPSILLGQLAGVLADRWNKVPLMIITDFIRSGLTVVLFFAAGPWMALPIMFLRSTAAIFNVPAQQALLRNVVAEEQLLKATTMVGMVFQISKVAGPLLGSVLISFVSIKICLIFNAVSFLVSGLILLTVGKISETEQEATEKAEDKTGLFHAWMQGWRMMFSIRVLWTSFVFFLIGFLSLQIVDAQLGVLLREVVPDRSALYGYVVASIAMGTFCVGGILTSLKDLKAYGWQLGGGCLLLGVCLAGMGLYQPGGAIAWLLAWAFVGGIGVGMSFIGFNFLRQKETPQEMMGRITGITNSLTSLMVVVGPIFGSFLIESLGVGSAFRVAGYLLILIGLIGVVMQRAIWRPAKAWSTDENALGGRR